LTIPRLAEAMKARISARSSEGGQSDAIRSTAWVVLKPEKKKILNMSLRAAIRAFEKPLRRSPMTFRPRTRVGRCPTTRQKGRTSWVIMDPPPMKAKRPIRQNWWVPLRAPIVAKSPTRTCPPSVPWWRKIVRSPMRQSWATWEKAMK